MRDLAKSVVVYGIASGISKSLTILLVPIYTKLFTTADYAVIDLVTSLFYLIAVISLLQVESALSRYYYEVDREKLKIYIASTLIFVTIASAFFTIICFSLSELISTLLFNNLSHAKAIQIASLSIPFFNLFSVFTVILRFEKKMLLYMVFVISQVFFTVTLTILLVKFLEFGIEGVFYGQLVGYIVPVLFILIVLREFLSLTLDGNTIRLFLKYSLPLVPSVIGSWVNTYVSRFIMLAYIPLALIGIYSAAVKIASAVNILQFAFSMAWIPFLFQTIKQENYKPVLQKVFILSTASIFALSILFSVWSDTIMQLFTSGDYIKGSSYVGIIVLSLALNFLFQIVCIGPSISTKTIYNTITFFISVSVNILLLYILIPFFNINGVLIAYFVSSLIMLLSGWYFSERLFPVGFSFKFFIIGLTITFTVIISTSFYPVAVLLKVIITLILAAVLAYFVLKSQFAKDIIIKLKGSRA